MDDLPVGFGEDLDPPPCEDCIHDRDCIELELFDPTPCGFPFDSRETESGGSSE